MESVETVDEWVLMVLRVPRSSPSSVGVFEGWMIRSSRMIEDRPGEETVAISLVEYGK